jgi:hypothetical protein
MIIILFNVRPRGINEKWRINLDAKRMILADARVIPNPDGRGSRISLNQLIIVGSNFLSNHSPFGNLVSD